MPQAAVIPSLRYRDCHAAIDWLVRVFGFTAQAVFEGPDHTIAHAQLTLGRGMIMLGSASNSGGDAASFVQPEQLGGSATGQVYLVVEDIEAVYAAAKQAGAQITGEMRVMEYGGRGFGCTDLEGYFWSVGEYDPWAAVQP